LRGYRPSFACRPPLHRPEPLGAVFFERRIGCFAMRVISTVAEMEAARAGLTGTVGLVPTMGYLHGGHLSLVRQAYAANDHVIVSIFVNPAQFGPGEDLARYPRNLDRDRRLLESEGAHAAFVPPVEEMYPPGFADWVEVHGPLTEHLEGTHRPGHFRGVTTVVARLFGIIRPDRAYFGQKDAQQLRAIKRMVADIHSADPEAFDRDVEIVAMPTVREPDGLAMSSRNVYLSPEEREAALALPRALALARRLVMTEGETDAGAIRQAVRAALETHHSAGPEALVGRAGRPRLALDYVSVSDEQTLEEVETIDRPALVLLAAGAGTTRLIDNTIVVPKGMSVPDHLQSLIEADTASLSPTGI